MKQGVVKRERFIMTFASDFVEAIPSLIYLYSPLIRQLFQVSRSEEGPFMYTKNNNGPSIDPPGMK